MKQSARILITRLYNLTGAGVAGIRVPTDYSWCKRIRTTITANNADDIERYARSLSSSSLIQEVAGRKWSTSNAALWLETWK